jgi:hypothetical protein
MNEDLASRVAKLETQLHLAERYSMQSFWQGLDVSYASTLATREITCIVCDHKDKRSGYKIHTDTCMFGGGKLERYECPDCGCIFGPMKYLDLSEEFVGLDYELLYSRYSESNSTPREIRTFHSLTPKQEDLFLDWGCGGIWSETITQLRASGWNVWGYEPSAAEPSEYVVNHRGSISAKFSGIFSNNVVEHFRNPVAQFKDFHTILAKGGSMAHTSPCYDYCYAFTRFHSLFLLGNSAEILAEKTGFKLSARIRDGESTIVVFEKI